MKNKQMNIEDIINVLCHYDYERVKVISNKLSQDSYLCGMAADDEKKIYINKDLPYKLMRETVLHEIRHCYHFLNGDLDGLSLNEQEKYVDKQTKYQMKELYKTKRLDL